MFCGQGWARCCIGDPDAKDCGSTGPLPGAARQDVMKFSEDEAAWIAVFLEAWTQSTDNGYSNLKKLEECPIPFVLVPCMRFKLPEGVIVDL